MTYTTKYICPWHPEVQSEKIGGRCQKCGGERCHANVRIEDGAWHVEGRMLTDLEFIFCMSGILFLPAVLFGNPIFLLGVPLCINLFAAASSRAIGFPEIGRFIMRVCNTKEPQ